MATYTFDYPVSKISIGERGQDVTRIILKVVAEMRERVCFILHIYYEETDVLDLMKIFAAGKVKEIEAVAKDHYLIAGS